MQWEPYWTFQTSRFLVIAEIAPEDMDPADSFEFPEDIAAVRNGEVDWFQVRVRVLHNGSELGADYLGGCAYRNAHEFFTGHRDADPLNRNSTVMRAKNGENVSICHYFPGMVSEAIREARKSAQSLKRDLANIHA